MSRPFFSPSTFPRMSASEGKHHPRPWKHPALSVLTAFRPHGILCFSGATMKLQRITLITILIGTACAAAMAQTPQNPAPEKRADPFAAPQGRFVDPKNASSTKESARAEAYYNFTMGHIYEQQYEATSRPEYATQAIEAYKKAYTLDPKSPVIGERLAEIYWKAQRTHEAVTEAQEILKRNPDHRAIPRDSSAGSHGRGIRFVAGAALPAEERA